MNEDTIVHYCPQCADYRRYTAENRPCPYCKAPQTTVHALPTLLNLLSEATVYLSKLESRS